MPVHYDPADEWDRQQANEDAARRHADHLIDDCAKQIGAVIANLAETFPTVTVKAFVTKIARAIWDETNAEAWSEDTFKVFRDAIEAQMTHGFTERQEAIVTELAAEIAADAAMPQEPPPDDEDHQRERDRQRFRDRLMPEEDSDDE